MTISDLSGKLGLDTTDFRTAIAAANRELRVIESGFRASAAALGDWAKDATGLEQRIGSLTKAIDLQRVKVSALQEEYDRIAGAQGKNSKAAQDMLIRLNKETESLGKMQSELGQTEKSLVVLRNGAKKAGDGVDDLKNKQAGATRAINTFKGALTGLGGALRTTAAGMGALSRSAVSVTRSAANAALSLGRTVTQTAARISMSVAIMAVTAAAAIGGMLFSTIGPASDLAETGNKIGEVFGDAAGTVNAFAADSASAFGQSRQQALDAAATFGVFGKSAGLTGDGLADFSTDLVGLSSDLASFYNATPEEVIGAIGAALRGESEPIRKYGVLLDDATLRQEAFAMGITSSTKDALTPQQKVLAANAVIMKQTAIAQGDFARTSGGLANQQRILTAQIANLKTVIGKGLLPVVTAGYQGLTRLLATPAIQKGVENLSEGFGSLGSAVMSALSGNSYVAIREFVMGIGNLGEAFGIPLGRAVEFGEGLVRAFRGALEMVGQVQSAFAEGGLAGGISAMLEPIRAMNPVFDAIGGTIERVMGYFSQFGDVVSSSGGDMGNMGAGLGGLIATILGDVLSNRGEMIQIGLSLLTGLVEGITGALPALLPVALQTITSLATFLVTALPMLLQTGIQILMTLINGIVPMLPMLMQTGVNMLLSLINGILPMLPMLLTTALQMIITLATGIAQALPVLIPAIIAIIPQMIMILLQNLPLLISAALQIILALATGLIAALPTLIAAIPQILQAVFDAIMISLPLIGEAAVQLILTLYEGIVGALPQIGEAAVQTIVTFAQGIQNLKSELLSVGMAILQGVWEGITGSWDWFLQNVMNFFSGMVSEIKALLGIASPSKVFADMGENMALGLGVGFAGEMDGVRRRIENLAGGLGGISVDGPKGSTGGAGAGAAGGESLQVNVNIEKVGSDVDVEVMIYKMMEAINRKRK